MILKIFGAIALVILSAILTLFFGDVYVSLKNKFFQDVAGQDPLDNLEVGVTLDYIKSIFGTPPAISREMHGLVEISYASTTQIKPVKADLSGLFEYIYRQEHYLLQIITDSDGTVVAYMVTARDPVFSWGKTLQVEMTTEHNGKLISRLVPASFILGKSSLAFIKNYIPFRIAITRRGPQQRTSYTEASILGGDSREVYIFGTSPAGTRSGNELASIERFFGRDEDSLKWDKEFLEFRQAIIPNTFGATQLFRKGLLEHLLLQNSIGFDYGEVVNLGR